MSKVNKSDIDQFIAEELGLDVKDIDKITDMFLGQVIDQAAQMGEVDLHRFGTFERYIRKARTARNPKTGEPISVPAKGAVKFRPWKAFRDAVV